MKTLRIVIAALILLRCSTPSGNQGESADSTNSVAADSLAGRDIPVGQSVEEETIVTFNPNDTTEQSVFLKWKEVSYSDYGPLYIFQDRKDEELRIRLIEIPAWDFEKNDYLDVAYPANSDFPAITIKQSADGRWYRAVLKMETRELDGVEQEVPIVKALTLVYSFE